MAARSSSVRRAINADEHAVFYLLGDACNHFNVTGVNLNSSIDIAVWERCAALTMGFVAAWTLDDFAGLEEVVGPAARAEPLLISIAQRVEAPAAWRVGSASLGATAHFRVLGEPGPAVLLLAAGTANLPTPIGPLLLDPATILGIAHGHRWRRRPDAAFAARAERPVAGRAVVPVAGSWTEHRWQRAYYQRRRPADRTVALTGRWSGCRRSTLSTRPDWW